MTRSQRNFTIGFLVALIALPGTSFGQKNCLGRQYPATATTVLARSVWVEVDLGFGLTYRGYVELAGTREPNKPPLEWYGKANSALHQKLDGKSITLCVEDRNSRAAFFYVDGKSVNDQMIDEGFLDGIPHPPFGVSTSF